MAKDQFQVFKPTNKGEEGVDYDTEVRARKVTQAGGEDVLTPTGMQHIGKGSYVVEIPESGRNGYDIVDGKAFEANYGGGKKTTNGGDNGDELKGEALNDALRERDLSTAGTADEKRARVAEYDAEQ